ncbi:hypothetical protein TNCV_4029731 [Trichonephila clavipes]|nr:hypothetical protein TNCV_4029731 [Trichonephila clavipes]
MAMNGYVNKQNCRIWTEANPQVYIETPLHPEKLTVWCALGAGGIIGPYFFKNDEGPQSYECNGDRVIERDLLTTVITELRAIMMSRSCGSNKTAQHVTHSSRHNRYIERGVLVTSPNLHACWTCELAIKIL